MKLSSFVQKQWSTAWPDVALKWGWAPEAICDHLQAVTDGRIKNLIINVPPGFGMTSILGAFWPAWEWADRGLTRNTFGMYSQSLPVACVSNSVLLRMGQLLGVGSMFTRELVRNGGGGQKICMEPWQGRLGWKFDRLILDEMNHRHSSPGMLDSDWHALSTELILSRPPNVGSAIVISHPRIGDGDLTDRILSGTTPGWTCPADFAHLMIPMEFDELRSCETSIGWKDPRSRDGELAWPERFDRACVDDFKAAAGQDKFNRHWQQLGLPLTDK